MTPLSCIEVNIQKHLQGFDLDVSFLITNQIHVLLGPSGSGKSLTLRLIAGLDRPDSGRIVFNGRCFYQKANPSIWVPPQHRQIGFVFQHHALFPHMSVLKNIIYGARNMDKDEAISAAQLLLKEFSLVGLESRYPHQISGGQKQRVAFARALIGNPKLLLLDEPFSALDNASRILMQEHLLRIEKERSLPILLVTHDLSEASRLSHQFLVCLDGKIIKPCDSDKIPLFLRSFDYLQKKGQHIEDAVRKVDE